MLGNFVKMTKQNKTDNYSSLRSLWPPNNTWGCLVVRDNWRLIYIYPDPANTLACRRHPPSMESIASYGGIVCPNAHKLCKLNCQSCRRIGKPCRRDDSSMSRRNLPQADAAHDSCHCHCHCDCLNCVATNSVIPKRMQTNKLTHIYFELVSTSAHSLSSQE